MASVHSWGNPVAGISSGNDYLHWEVRPKLGLLLEGGHRACHMAPGSRAELQAFCLQRKDIKAASTGPKRDFLGLLSLGVAYLGEGE